MSFSFNMQYVKRTKDAGMRGVDIPGSIILLTHDNWCRSLCLAHFKSTRIAPL